MIMSMQSRGIWLPNASSPVSARTAIMEKTKHPFIGDSQVSIAMNSAERGRRGAVAQHDERRCGTMRATRFRRVALFAERPGGTGKKVKDREIDVAPWFCTGPCVSKRANHWQANAPRRARVARRASTRSGRATRRRRLSSGGYSNYLLRTHSLKNGFSKRYSPLNS